MPATMPQWSRYCTLIEDAIGFILQKYHSSPLNNKASTKREIIESDTYADFDRRAKK